MGSDSPKSRVEVEFAEIDARRGWTQLFQEIRSESLQNDFTIQAAVKSKNKNLNRYRDVNPYDHSRIVLTKGKCDYINANLVKIKKAGRQYILTQGPLSFTTGHFWLMVWEQNCKAVVMLNRIIEKSQEKCHQYWPLGEANGGEDTLILKDVGLVVEYLSEKEASYYTTRILRLTEVESGVSREVIQFHYTTWPDFGVPQSPTAFLRFLASVRKSGALSPDVGPPVVHCSAGIGRSGTFCLVDSSLILMAENGVNSVNVKELLLEMRSYRMGLIQTPDQLRFSYQAIIEGTNTKDWDLVNDNDVQDELNRNVREEGEGGLKKDLASALVACLARSREGEGEDSEESISESDSSSGDREDTPPPLPPTRTCSLQPSRPLPSEPPEHNNMGQGVRARKMAASREKTAEQVAEMKRKQEAAESWSRMKSGEKRRRPTRPDQTSRKRQKK